MKEWLERFVSHLNEIESKRKLSPATRELIESTLRHVKGIITAFERWYKATRQ
jgi:hypothetical protein